MKTISTSLASTRSLEFRLNRRRRHGDAADRSTSQKPETAIGRDVTHIIAVEDTTIQRNAVFHLDLMESVGFPGSAALIVAR